MRIRSTTRGLKTTWHQALRERLKLIHTPNKIDRLFLELHVDGVDAYHTLLRVIENVNGVMATYEDDMLGNVQVYPEKETIAFSVSLYIRHFRTFLLGKGILQLKTIFSIFKIMFNFIFLNI